MACYVEIDKRREDRLRRERKTDEERQAKFVNANLSQHKINGFVMPLNARCRECYRNRCAAVRQDQHKAALEEAGSSMGLLATQREKGRSVEDESVIG